MDGEGGVRRLGPSVLIYVGQLHTQRPNRSKVLTNSDKLEEAGSQSRREVKDAEEVYRWHSRFKWKRDLSLGLFFL